MIHYLLIRRDLPFGVTLAQLAHAAANSMADWIEEHTYTHHSGHIVFPNTYGMTVVVLGVRDRVALKNWEMRLKRKHVPLTTVSEPDEPWNGQLMAIGIWPGLRQDLEGHFKKLQTYTEFNSQADAKMEMVKKLLSNALNDTFERSENMIDEQMKNWPS